MSTVSASVHVAPAHSAHTPNAEAPVAQTVSVAVPQSHPTPAAHGPVAKPSELHAAAHWYV